MRINDLRKQKNVEVLNASSQKEIKGGANTRFPNAVMSSTEKCPPPILETKAGLVV